MKKIVILCAGDFGKEVVWLLEDINKVQPTYEILGFLDDNIQKKDQIYNGYKCLGPISQLTELNRDNDVCAVIATQDGGIRKKIVEMHCAFSNWETLIHPNTNISSTTTIGKGCIICANSSISVNADIGNQCIMNLGTTIGHDCEIDDYVSMMSGTVISGHVKIAEGAYFGSNSTVIPNRKIGSYSKVGAGSVVIRNVKDGTTVMGVPAVTLRM